MEKHIDIDILRKEIKRRRLHFNKEAEKYQALNNGYSQNCYGARDALRDLENFLDTLSEKPDKSLEEAAENYEQTRNDLDAISDNEIVRRAFIAGAEWQASQMPMPEDTVIFNKGVAEGRRLEREDMLKDAMEADVNTYKDPVLNCGWAEFVVDMPSSETDKFGDKVRIVVLKAEEE